jgi:hypothetical protein
MFFLMEEEAEGGLRVFEDKILYGVAID